MGATFQVFDPCPKPGKLCPNGAIGQSSTHDPNLRQEKGVGYGLGGLQDAYWRLQPGTLGYQSGKPHEGRGFGKGAPAPYGYQPAGVGKGPGLNGDWVRSAGDTKLFSEKVATNKESQFDGVKNGALWSSTTRNYFVSRAHELNEILRLIESHEDVEATVFNIAPHVQHLATAERLRELAKGIWGYLNFNLVGEAKMMFNNCLLYTSPSPRDRG